MILDQPMTALMRVLNLIVRVVKHFRSDRCLRVASALSFTTLLALVPLVTVIFSMFSLFPVFDKWALEVQSFLFQNFVPAAGETVRQYLAEFSSKAGRLTAVGLVVLLLSALLLLSTIEDAFNDIWRVKKGRAVFLRLLTYWAVITLGPMLMVVSLSMSSTLLSLKVISDQSLIATATGLFLSYMPVLFEFVCYVLFYKAIPNTEVKLRHAVIGALVATLFFELAKYGFALYILNFKSYQLIYGALATIPIFFVWVYVSWIVMLVGAVLAAVLHIDDRAKDMSQSEALR